MSDSEKRFTHDDYEIIKRIILYQGVFRLVKYQVRHRKFRGDFTNIFERELLERQPAAAVLPYDPKLDKVILIEQFRIGAIANPQSPWLIEIVAGVYDHSEIPADVARREAYEEAGVEIHDLYPICNYFVSPGGTNEYIHVYCGRVDSENSGGIFGLIEENEDIRAMVLTVDEAYQWVQEGKIKTSPAIIAVQWLVLNHLWLKQLWQTKN